MFKNCHAYPLHIFLVINTFAIRRFFFPLVYIQSTTKKGNYHIIAINLNTVKHTDRHTLASISADMWILGL